MLFLKQPLISPVLCHKSVTATTCQIDLKEVLNSMPGLCNCVKTKIIEPTAPPQ